MKFFLSFCFYMMTYPAFAQLEKRLDSVINSSIQAGEPGIALYVETMGKIVYKRGFGLADTEKNKKI